MIKMFVTVFRWHGCYFWFCFFTIILDTQQLVSEFLSDLIKRFAGQLKSQGTSYTDCKKKLRSNDGNRLIVDCLRKKNLIYHSIKRYRRNVNEIVKFNHWEIMTPIILKMILHPISTHIFIPFNFKLPQKIHCLKSLLNNSIMTIPLKPESHYVQLNFSLLFMFLWNSFETFFLLMAASHLKRQMKNL